jgi:hypothetical protein
MTAQIVQPSPAPTAQHRAPMGGGRITLIVLGAMAALLGLVLMIVAAVLGGVGRLGDDSYLETRPGRLTTETYAVTVPGVNIDLTGPEVAFARDLFGTVRVQATGNAADVPLFIGIGPSDDVAAYLSGVGHAELTDVDTDPFRAEYDTVDGDAPGAPEEQEFWAVSDSGTGERTLDWDVAPGLWTVVVMNADGSAGVDADVTLGGSMRILGLAAAGVLAAGVVILVLGVLLIVIPLATRGYRTA